MKSTTCILTIAASLVSLLALVSCVENVDEATEKKQAPRRAVKVTEVVRKTAVRERAYPSVLEPLQITPLAFDVGGRVGQVDLQIGQRVVVGEQLAQIEPRDFELSLAQAQAAVREAESSLENARKDLDRRKRLFERGVTSRATLDEAETTLSLSQARVDQAKRSMELAAESLEDTKLTAPFDGLINTIDVDSFESVQPGARILTLYQEGALQAEVLIGFDVLETISVGQSVVVSVGDRPDLQLEGTITEIAQRAPAVSAFPVIVTLDQPGPFLRSGIPVEVVIQVPFNSKKTVSLPLSALITHLDAELKPVPNLPSARGGKVFVYSPDTKVLAIRDVTIVGMNEAEMQILDGLTEGEKVVSAGVPFLQPGQAVAEWRSGDGGER
ncbi:efflux RND transporter periplasmic adaptor subunit [Labrenzia sp. CE80]|uniref:efflux RND transporter periplasmic adaptor subunit n=1 Tax=Labrenzia sp. CE80 TaxID=1788986 RepID=UPI00138A2BA8|nr:efflux RND transporter periplasmic adaptor subunit [Labrenzia sp. CE80]